MLAINTILHNRDGHCLNLSPIDIDHELAGGPTAADACNRICVSYYATMEPKKGGKIVCLGNMC